MRETTDMTKVKSTARMLLWTDVHKTPYSPIIVQHPFTSSGFVFIPGDEFPIDITKNAENLNRWREYMGKKVDEAVTASCICIMLNKAYGLTFLKLAEPYLSSADLSELLADAWIRSENPNMDEERKRLAELDDTITIYRGVTPYNAKNVRALSWTTDIKKAEWFANRYGQCGTVYKAQISKAKVLAYFTGRGESEIIVNPKELKNLQAI